jgi:hypothetical protein
MDKSDSVTLGQASVLSLRGIMRERGGGGGGGGKDILYDLFDLSVFIFIWGRGRDAFLRWSLTGDKCSISTNSHEIRVHE